MENQWIVGETVCDGKIARGELRLPLSGTERAGHCFTTERIETGLGPGVFDLHFFSVDQNGFDGGLLAEDRLVFGDPSVFSQSSFVPSVPAISMGAYGDPVDGTFCLGVMLHENVRRGELVINWWAEKPAEEKEEPAVEEPAAEEPAAVEPTAEEPTAEEPDEIIPEPTVEEPTAEEPVVEEPTAEEPDEIIPEPMAEEPDEIIPEPMAEEPVAEVPAAEEPAAEEPAAEELAAEEPVAEESDEFIPEPVAEAPDEFIPEPAAEAPEEFILEPVAEEPDELIAEPMLEESDERIAEPIVEIPVVFAPEPVEPAAPETIAAQAAPDLPDWFKAVIAELEAAEAEAKRAEAAKKEAEQTKNEEPAAVGVNRPQSILDWFNSDDDKEETPDDAPEATPETEVDAPEISESMTEYTEPEVFEPVRDEPKTEEPAPSGAAMPDWLHSVMAEIKGNDAEAPDLEPFRFKPLDDAQDDSEPAEPESADDSQAGAVSAEFETGQFRPTEYEPTEYVPTEYEPTEYEPTEYEPTEYEPMNFEPLDIDFSQKDQTDASSSRSDSAGIKLIKFDINPPELRIEEPATPVRSSRPEGYYEKQAPVIAVPDMYDLKAAALEEEAHKEEIRQAENYSRKAPVIPLPEEKEPVVGEPGESFFINLAPRTLAPGRSFPFSCVKPAGTEVEWFVGPDGGEITEEGFYTAPMEPGVYMVGARIRGTGREVSQYVMVR